jgi:cold shock CspA family protein
MEQDKKIGRHVGTCQWFTKNFGFIKPCGEGAEIDIFVYYTDIVCEGFKTLKKDQKVEYSIGVNKRGQPIAVDVVVIK